MQVKYPRSIPLRIVPTEVSPKNDSQKLVTPKPVEDLPVPRKKLRAKYPKGFHIE